MILLEFQIADPVVSSLASRRVSHLFLVIVP